MPASKKYSFILALALCCLKNITIVDAREIISTVESPSTNLIIALPHLDSVPVIFDIVKRKLSELDALQTSKINIEGKNSSKDETEPKIKKQIAPTEQLSSVGLASEFVSNPFSVQLFEALRINEHYLEKTQNVSRIQDKAIKDFYEARAYQPLWTDKNGYNQQAKSVKAVLDNASENGLKASSYKALDFNNNQVEAEISFTNAVVKYARDAGGARLNPRNISKLITVEPTIAQPKDILLALDTSSDAGKTLEEYNPQHGGYKALKTVLVKEVDPQNQADIIANMERWRWVPRDLGSAYILVNVPEYQLSMVRNGTEVHRARIIVGKPETPSPVFSGNMDHVIVNPYWNIPPSIALKEMLPKLQKNPYAMQAKGFEIVKRGRVVDPATIDWSGGVKNITIRQPPGERNALGFVKFMFPNDHAVYLHDTPSRGLFANSERAFSHGCIRVQNPFKLAEIILSVEHNLSEERLHSMAGGSERYFNMQTKLPVHLVYFTNFVDEYGQLETRPDIYGFNRRVKTALGF